MAKKERWAVADKRIGLVTAYWCRSNDPMPWSRMLKRIKWYKTREEAERSFDHSMYVVVPESEVVADLVMEAVSEATITKAEDDS